MQNLTGKTRVTVDGSEYTLFLGFSGLAELQDRHGQAFLEQLQPPEDAPEGWMPPMKIVCDLLLESLQRFHGDEADRFLADDIFAENPEAINSMLEASFGQDDASDLDAPDAEGGNSGN